MPSKSKAQHNFMAAVANNPAFAKKAGVPQSVGKEFSNADKGRKFSKGGDMKSENMMMKKEGRGMAKADMMKNLKAHAAKPASKAHKGLAKGGMASKMGAVKTAAPSKDGVATKGKTKGTMIKMAGGGKTC
jgi:hypothetical protein